MSYAEAASSEKCQSSDLNPSSNSSFQRRYYNETLILCLSDGFTYEKLAEVLHRGWFLCVISGLQKVDYGRRYALVVEDPQVRDTLVSSGLNDEGIHVTFTYHKRREQPRVYVSQLPLGISKIDIRRSLTSLEILLK